jgi:hypothetical protein
MTGAKFMPQNDGEVRLTDEEILWVRELRDTVGAGRRVWRVLLQLTIIAGAIALAVTEFWGLLTVFQSNRH